MKNMKSAYTELQGLWDLLDNECGWVVVDNRVGLQGIVCTHADLIFTGKPKDVHYCTGTSVAE